MGSESALRLPIVDFTKEDLKPGTPEWRSLKTQVKQALQEYGCFEALYNTVPSNLSIDLYEGLTELFDLPLETKLRNRSNKPFHGYVGQYPIIPLYESMGIDDVDIPEKAESFVKTLWPQGNPKFSEFICKAIGELDHMVRRMVLENLGVEKYYDKHIESTNHLLRVMKYKGPQTSEAKIGLNSHTDKNILTILHQNQVAGLEVQAKDGEWFDVKPSLNSFIVMIGDSFLAWVNDSLHSPFHRVVMTGNDAQYSVGLFSVPKAGYMVKAPEELVDEEHPLLFKPFDHVKFLDFYYTPEGQRYESALKAYCGA